MNVFKASRMLPALGLWVSLYGCGSSSMSGQSASAAGKPENNAASNNGSGSAASTSPSGKNDENATAAASSDSPPNVNTTLTVSKSTAGIGALEDKPVTLTIAPVLPNGSFGPSQQITFQAGQQGNIQVPNICTGSTTTVAVAVAGANSGAGGLLGSLLGGGGAAVATSPGQSSSQITFNPASCIVSKMLAGNKGDTINFSCPDHGAVNVLTK